MEMNKCFHFSSNEREDSPYYYNNFIVDFPYRKLVFQHKGNMSHYLHYDDITNIIKVLTDVRELYRDNVDYTVPYISINEYFTFFLNGTHWYKFTCLKNGLYFSGEIPITLIPSLIINLKIVNRFMGILDNDAN